MYVNDAYRSMVFERKVYVLSGHWGLTLCACCPVSLFVLYECAQGIWNTRRVDVGSYLRSVRYGLVVHVGAHADVYLYVAVLLVHLLECVIGSTRTPTRVVL